MLLNAAILYDRLHAELGASASGPEKAELSLKRPLALDGTATELADNQLYVCLGRQLPRYPRIERGVVVVVVGRGSLLSWYEDRCRILLVPDDADFFHAFNACQRLFDEMDEWERALERAQSTEEPIQVMADASRRVFGNQAVVIDESFRFLARTDPADERTSMTLDTIQRYGDARELAVLTEEPFVLHHDAGTSLSVNLVEAGRFLGCVFVLFGEGDVPSGAGALLGYLAQAVKNALLKGARPIETDADLRRWALHGLVDERPLDQRERDLLETGMEQAHVCVCLGLSRFRGRLPVSYLAARVERALPNCVAFEADDGVLVAFAAVDADADACVGVSAGARVGGGEAQFGPEAVAEFLLPVLASAKMSCGVSETFSDPFAARMYFLQARDALNIGHAFDPASAIHRFGDIALADILRRAFSELPLEAFMGPGLRRLAEHDASSQASYLATLAIFLDNNMSPTAAARSLGVHRSTLVERLERIFSLLGSGLEDPDERLLVQIVLRSMRLRGEFSDTGELKGDSL